MRFGLSDTDILKIKSVLDQYPAISEAIIYGSRAKGNYKPASDIDLVLRGDALNTDVLNRISAALDDLLLPYTFDISLLHHIRDQSLLDHIARVGLPFNY